MDNNRVPMVRKPTVAILLTSSFGKHTHTRVVAAKVAFATVTPPFHQCTWYVLDERRGVTLSHYS